MKICPKCGGDEFIVTAHVTQSWKVDKNENWLETISECDDITHRPDDDDIWVCANCGFDAAGREFNVSDEENITSQLITLSQNEYENIIEYVKKDYQIMEENEWGLANLPFKKDFFSDDAMNKMGIESVLKENDYKLSLSEIRDEENETGLHLYWDKTNNPEEIAIGLYVLGSGDIRLNFTLSDILPQKAYDELFSYGYKKLDYNGKE